MLSLSSFRKDLLPLFRIMLSTGGYLDLRYKGRIYRVYVEDLGPAPKRKYKRKSTLEIVRSECAICGGLEINGYCMDRGYHSGEDEPDSSNSTDGPQSERNTERD